MYRKTIVVSARVPVINLAIAKKTLKEAGVEANTLSALINKSINAVCTLSELRAGEKNTLKNAFLYLQEEGLIANPNKKETNLEFNKEKIVEDEVEL